MKTFNYHSAKDVKEASKLASSSSAFLAGGMTTIPSMKLGLASYKDIIDIKKIKKLSGIKVTSKYVTIGATTKHVEVANSKEIKKAIPSLAALAEGIGDPQVRNRGTIGGSIVPLFLTCGSPIPSAKAAKEGIAFLICFELATSTCFVVAPIVMYLPVTLIPESFFIFLISIISL
jgi:CO/xanthine dehydrogenase FAD-binding subunit